MTRVEAQTLETAPALGEERRSVFDEGEIGGDPDSRGAEAPVDRGDGGLA
jgi:hypothetical protein